MKKFFWKLLKFLNLVKNHCVVIYLDEIMAYMGNKRCKKEVLKVQKIGLFPFIFSSLFKTFFWWFFIPHEVNSESSSLVDDSLLTLEIIVIIPLFFETKTWVLLHLFRVPHHFHTINLNSLSFPLVITILLYD